MNPGGKNTMNKGNEEWRALGTKDRKPGPPVHLRLRPEDAYQQKEAIRGTVRSMSGRGDNQ